MVSLMSMQIEVMNGLYCFLADFLFLLDFLKDNFVLFVILSGDWISIGI